MRLSGSHLVSLAILAGIGGWMITGTLVQGGVENPNATTIAERESARKTEAFRVRVTTLQPTEKTSSLNIRGRTQAEAVVTVRSETAGTVEKRPLEKGQMVKAGDLLCVIDQGVRLTALQQAKAQLEQAQEDFTANERLVARGFATKSKLRQLRAGLDAAKSAVASAEQEVSRTEVRATTAGLVQEPMAEIGDNLSSGGVCVTLMQAETMLFTGQVSERDVGRIKLGMPADVRLVGGEKVTGTVSYISQAADAKTRTFKIDIELPNPDLKIRDGLTASAEITLQPDLAYQVASSWLTLADDGEIGVRAVSNANIVEFHPVRILSQDDTSMWVTGLEPGIRIITLGQNFVSSGEIVDPVTAEQLESLKRVSEEKRKSASEDVKS